jgi:hypothetical protein
MNVPTANVIRFPVMAPAMPQRVAPEAAAAADEPAKVVAFAPVQERMGIDERMQEYGQLFVAERTVGRVADQLDAVATL